MENCLLREPNIRVVYAINEPAAAGAHEALQGARQGRDVVLVSVDGGCPGVRNVADGVIGATAQQYPLVMAAMGVEAVATFVRTGQRPAPPQGRDFFDTGTVLVTDRPVAGLQSIGSATVSASAGAEGGADGGRLRSDER